VWLTDRNPFSFGLEIRIYSSSLGNSTKMISFCMVPSIFCDPISRTERAGTICCTSISKVGRSGPLKFKVALLPVTQRRAAGRIIDELGRPHEMWLDGRQDWNSLGAERTWIQLSALAMDFVSGSFQLLAVTKLR